MRLDLFLREYCVSFFFVQDLARFDVPHLQIISFYSIFPLSDLNMHRAVSRGGIFPRLILQVPMSLNRTRTYSNQYLKNTSYKKISIYKLNMLTHRSLCSDSDAKGNAVRVHLGDTCLKIPGVIDDMNYIWLRENCSCDMCYNAKHYQIMFHAHKIDPEIRPESATYLGDELQLVWPGGHVSNYSLNWLRENSFPCATDPKTKRMLWDREALQFDKLPRVDVDYYMKDENGVTVCNIAISLWWDS